MARSTKSSAKSKATTKAEVKADVEDAVVLPEEDQSAEAIAEEGPAAATSKSEDAKAVSEKPVVDDTTTEAVAEDTVTETPPVDDDTTSRDDTPEPETTTAILPPPVTQDVTVQKVGFLPTLGGGVIAAGLGYFAATQGFGQNTEDLSPLLDEQSAQIEELNTAIAAIPAAPELPDLAPLEASVTALQEDATAQFAGLGEQLAGLEQRLTAVERAPTEDGGISDTAITSIERELEGLRTEIAAQETRIQDMADQAAADLAAARAETEAIEAEAQAQAEAALAAAAIAEVRIAMDSGEPFDAALADLEAAGVDVPDAIAAVAADGLPTETELTAEFPALARAALATARAEGLGQEDGGGMGAFLRNQFNVRSVEPREGDDPDAILSRAEAALRGGDLETTLTEVSALPETVRANFADWLAAAEARKDALAAVVTLSSTDAN